VGDVLADPLDTGLVGRPVEARVEDERPGRGDRLGGPYGRGQAGMDVVEPAGQAAPVALERPAADPGVAGPPVPATTQSWSASRRVQVWSTGRRRSRSDRTEVELP
jgi:hypothetical protein